MAQPATHSSASHQEIRGLAVYEFDLDVPPCNELRKKLKESHLFTCSAARGTHGISRTIRQTTIHATAEVQIEIVGDDDSVDRIVLQVSKYLIDIRYRTAFRT